MATKFLTSLDLTKNELQNARIQNLATPPAAPVEGQVYWDTAMEKLRVWDGTAWQTLSESAGTVTTVTATSPVNSTGGTAPVISIDSASTSGAGAVQLSNDINSADQTKAATSKAVYDAYVSAISYADSLTTDDVAEGSVNKYFTDERAQDAIGLNLGSGRGYDDTTGSIYPDLAPGGGIIIDGLNHIATDPTYVALVNEYQTLTNKTLTSPIVNGDGIYFEGVTVDGYETQISVVDPTQDNVINFPDQSGEVVVKDGSGNFSANVITADLNGTAANASELEGMAGSYYLDRANHTGTQFASTISDLAATVQNYRLDQFEVPNTNVSLDGYKLIDVGNPDNPQDVATKAYVDATAQGLTVKDAVHVASVANIASLSGLLTIDGHTLQAGERILVKNQNTGSENGIYVAASGAWSRAADADGAGELNPGSFVFVEMGDTQADSGWVVTNDGVVTIGVTAITFAQFSGAGQITAGDGLSKTGNLLYVNVDGTTIEISSDALRVKDGGISAVKMDEASVDLGTAVVTGTLPVSNGGTGASTLTSNGVLLGSGTSAIAATAAGSANQVLRIPGAGGAPAFGAIDLEASAATTGTLPVSKGGTGATNVSDARDTLAGSGFTLPRKKAGSDSWTANQQKTLTHNLGTKDVTVALYDVSDNMVLADVVADSTSAVKVTISLAGTYRYVIIG